MPKISCLREVVNRVSFCLYLFGVLSSWGLIAIGLAKQQPLLILGAAGLLVGWTLFRRFGISRLDFELSGRVFPYGLIDSLDCSRNYRRLDEILTAARNPANNWIRRAELRRELTGLLEFNPGYLIRFRKEIDTIQPSLGAGRPNMRS